MPNIFDGLEKLDDSIIRENIAMIEATNIGTIMKGYGTTISNKGAKLINGIGGFLGKNPNLIVKKEKRLDDYIEDKKYEIRNLSRNELNHILKNVLRETIDCSLYTDDSISAGVITSVAKYMKIGDNMTVAQKADGIHRRYLEKIFNATKEKLQDQNEAEANSTINKLQKSIDNLDEKDKNELKNILKIDKLTGKEVRTVFIKAGTPTLIIGALSTSGFGAYMALTTIMNAIFTTMFNIVLPFAVYTTATSALSLILGPVGIALVGGTTIWQITKGNKKIKNEIMGQIVYSAVSANGGSYVAKDEELPSYEDNSENVEKIRIIDEEYNKLITENKSLQSKVSMLEDNCNKYQKGIVNYENIIDDEKKRRKNSEKEIIKLKNDIEDISRNLRKSESEVSELENKINEKEDEELKVKLKELKELNDLYLIKLKELNNNIVYQNLIIEDASNEINDKEACIKENIKEKIKLQNENENYRKKMKIKDEKIEKIEKTRKKEIQEKWVLHYPKFEIKTSAIRDTVSFSKKEIWEIERALMELHSLDDYKSVSIGKIKENGVEYEHMGVSLPDGFPTRILYRIINNSNKKVIIEKIYKHNAKIYQ